MPLPVIDLCLDEIDDNLIADCLNLPFAGTEVNVRIINRNDIDYALSTFNADKTICTALVLKAGKEAYTITGFKKSNDVGFKLVKNESFSDTFEHEFKGVVFDRKASTLKQINKLASGSKLVVAVEYKSKGATNTEAFMIYGFSSGLELQEASHTANSANGTIPLRLASTKGEEEPRTPCLYLVTDYATTKTAFNAL